MAFFPFMIQMQDKLCVIGGGGKVAYRIVSMMLSFGARVTVIAPKICDELQKIESKQDVLFYWFKDHLRMVISKEPMW